MNKHSKYNTRMDSNYNTDNGIVENKHISYDN